MLARRSRLVCARALRRAGLIAPLLVFVTCLGRPTCAAAQEPPEPSDAGRVLVTVTTLEGTVQMPGVAVELKAVDGGLTIARTLTDGAGRVQISDVPPGRYTVSASRPGFAPRDANPFDVRAGQLAQVLLDIQLTFSVQAVEVRADTPSPTDSVRPVSMSDMLAGSVLDIAPIPGDDFQSLLPLLPGVVRGPDGRLRVKGGQPTQGALQVSSTSLVDPSTGDFDLDLPSQSVDSVEVLSNPFAAEYGRFSTSITQIRTRRASNEWEVKPGNLMPRIGGSRVVRGFEPRLSIRGPIKKDYVFFSQDLQFRYVATPVRSLPDEPEIALRSFDSFTRFDTVLSSRHTFGGGAITFPREIERWSMTTFRGPETTPTFSQDGLAVGIVDRFAIAPDIVLESTLAGRTFEVNVDADVPPGSPMVYAPDRQGGAYFNDQEREVAALQWVEALTISRDRWRGQHVFKFGVDTQRSHFDGFSTSRPLEIRRLDGSLAELTTFGERREQQVSGVEIGMFAQDRWRMGDRVTMELGLRFDKDQITDRVNWSPRTGIAVAVLPEGRAILRGGVGKFVQRTPLNVSAFGSYEGRESVRFDTAGAPLAPPLSLAHVSDSLRTPEAIVGNVEWNQRFGRRVLLKANYLQRRGTHDYIVSPDPERGELRLSSTGRSAYREVEATARYLGGDRKDLTFSYVWSRATGDLNSYDQFFGNIRTPIIRANERNLSPTDVPHRFLLRGTVGLWSGWDFAPVLELRSGFPWSAVDEFQDFVGPRNRAGRLPAVTTFDFSISRPWRLWKYRFRAGLRVYNALGASADRDVQQNVTAPDFGRFYNPIERSIGVMFGSVR